MFMYHHARGVLLGIALLLSFGITRAADLPLRIVKPEEVGLSSERLARLASVTYAHVESGRLPGAVIVITRDGHLAYAESFGYRDRAIGASMPTDAIFRIYSMTKPITSVAVMMLQEEGKLQVYDPVSRYLPEPAKRKVGVERTAPQTGRKSFETVETEREITI